MRFDFDYYHNLERTDMYLCNPDGRELFPLTGRNRIVTLRFNDISSLEFDIDPRVTMSNGDLVDVESYDYIQTKRLVFVKNIGWFQITSVDEDDYGSSKSKKVKAESLQTIFKNRGFLSEDRVYYFYNPNDPYDDSYDSNDLSHIPSVLGQLNKQLGIKHDLGQGDNRPLEPYDEWTVTYISPSLIYAGSSGTCRSFNDNVTFGYDWMVNDVENAFNVIVVFDFMYKTIVVKKPNEITTKTNVIYTFNNFIKSINISEQSDDIVTVLNCSGNNCDIRVVNPSGTNYICDFSYFMDKEHHRWMSDELIEKIEDWKNKCNANKGRYEEVVKELRNEYEQISAKKTELQEASIKLSDIRNAQSKRPIGQGRGICGVVAVERVSIEKKYINETLTSKGIRSILTSSTYYDTQFSGSTVITAYKSAPNYIYESQSWEFEGDYKTGTADEIISYNMTTQNTSSEGFWYFKDDSYAQGYCKLIGSSIVGASGNSTCYCGGFDRYIAYCHPVIEDGVISYVDRLQQWVNLRQGQINRINTDLYGYTSDIDDHGNDVIPTPTSLYGQANAYIDELDTISSNLNIISYFAKFPNLLKELNCYWIEGDYTNDNIAVLDSTTPDVEIDLCNELMSEGYVELSKVCKPNLSFSIESAGVIKQYEFSSQMEQLELGKIITVEKEEGVWYFPALLEIVINLDNLDDFEMSFANTSKLTDWGYQYADLIANSASTSRQVSSNWHDMMSYSKDKSTVMSIIRDPLNATLRAATANMTNQDFVVDHSGILGRQRSGDTFLPEQLRIINNSIIFTDDDWNTLKTALGKIRVGENKWSYGLAAETIIGEIIVGENLKIKNVEGTVEIGSQGITIKNADDDTVFSATAEGVGSMGGKDNFRWSLTSGGFYLYSGDSENPVMSVNGSEAVFTGTIVTSNATITGGSIEFTNASGNKTFTKIDKFGVNIGYGGSGISNTNIKMSPGGLDWRWDSFDDSDKVNELSFGSYSTDGMSTSAGLRVYLEDYSDFNIGVSNGRNGVGYAAIKFNMNESYQDCYGELIGTWKGTVTDPSDRNLKNSIESMSDKYGLFFDRLRPVRYKFNNGSSGRYHTGFIAQEVEDAIIQAGLTTDDAALFVEFKEKDKKTNEVNITSGLRYTEFVSLNTWQIQMLKHRVSQLEDRLSRYEKVES